ncbi:MAG TPA: hypothetical protein VIX90_02005 [Edaphobacter sp.]
MRYMAQSLLMTLLGWFARSLYFKVRHMYLPDTLERFHGSSLQQNEQAVRDLAGQIK